jgi:CBS domain-containing protein
MRRRVQEVMTTKVATVGERAPFKQIVRVLAERRISALPVLDAAGRVVGVVSEADLLKVFLRSDQDIHREIREDVLLRTMWLDPDRFTVEVRDGIVTLAGPLEFRSQIPIAVRLVHGVDGVVDVVDRLWFEVDDARDELRSTMWIDRAPAVRRRV